MPRNELHDRIEDVWNVSADGPRLLTLAVPPDESLDAALDRVEARHEDTQYLYAETQARVADAVTALREALDEYTTTPENGLVMFAGVVDGETVVECFDDLPSAVTESRQERAETFETEPLETALDGAPGDRDGGQGSTDPAASGDDGGQYGLLVVEREKAVLGRLATDGDDDTVEPLEWLRSDRAETNPSDDATGDSEAADREFFERVADAAEDAFLEDGSDDSDEGSDGVSGDAPEEATPDVSAIEGLLVGGSSVTASAFLDGDHLHHQLRNVLVGDTVAIGDATEEGLQQLADNAREQASATERETVREALGEFLARIEEGEEAVIGRAATEEALEYEGVETTLAAETLPAEECRDLARRTAAQGGEFVEVPTDMEGGDRLREEGPIGALTRFPIE